MTDRTDRADKQRTDSIGRTVLQTVGRTVLQTVAQKLWTQFNLGVNNKLLDMLFSYFFNLTFCVISTID